MKTAWIAAAIACYMLAACSSSFPPPSGPTHIWKPGEVAKIAVFPIEVRGNIHVSEGVLDDVHNGLEQSQDVMVSYSWYPEALGGISLTGDAEMQSQARTGSRKIPNVAYVQKKGRALGTDAVLLISLYVGSASCEFEGWMVDVATGRVTELRPPTANLATLHRIVIDGVEHVIQRYRDGI